MSPPRSVLPQPLDMGGESCPPGRRTLCDLRVARLPTGTWVSLPVAVLHGRSKGPAIWLSAAIHGDELNGIEIVREVLPRVDLDKLCGTIIAVPIVNVFGFMQQGRYLPDRRDLNRSFPGSARGSLAARLAHLFMREVVDHCDYGIDLHTGSNHRTNLAQVRADLSDARTKRLVRAFAAPVAVDSAAQDGTLRAAAVKRGKCVLLYEAGETSRFDRGAIRTGVGGVMRVLAALKMIPSAPKSRSPTRVLEETRWVRASRGGIAVLEVGLGDRVRSGEVIARITDTFSENEKELPAPEAGIVIGVSNNPVVNRGDALVHLGMI